MISGAFLPAVDSNKVTCDSDLAKTIIDEFTAKADRANRTLESDSTAEMHIEFYFQKALKDLQAITGEPDTIKGCLPLLVRNAARADAFRDGILKSYVSLNHLGMFYPMSLRAAGGHLTSGYLSFLINWIMVFGLPAFVAGISGNIERWNHSTSQ